MGRGLLPFFSRGGLSPLSYMREKFLASFLTLLGLAAPLHGQALDATACEKLASLKLENVRSPHSRSGLASSARRRSPPGGVPNAPQTFASLPAMCRVTATLKPSSDSDIKAEVWLPVSGWNGKLQGVGNGGWAGSIFYFMMATALRSGYAVVATDTGHAGGMGDGTFAFNHPEKLTDFAWRAVHEMTITAKAVIEAYYGSAPRLSYWNGCSTGGRQGLKEAQRYPSDYDGILDGAPANYMTHLATHSLWVAHATLKDAAGYIPKEKFVALHKAVIDACDGLDAVRDGVLENPSQCKVDPKSIECPAGTDAPTCLTAPQVEAARKILRACAQPADRRRDLPRPRARQRDGMGRAGRRAGAAQHLHRPFQVHRLQGPAVGLQDTRLRQKRREGGRDRQRPVERDEPEPARVLQPRRQDPQCTTAGTIR